MKYRKTVSESLVPCVSCYGYCQSSTANGISHCFNSLNAASTADTVSPFKDINVAYEILINEAHQ